MPPLSPASPHIPPSPFIGGEAYPLTLPPGDAGICRGGMDGDDWGILGMGGDAQDRPAPHLIIFLNFFGGRGKAIQSPGACRDVPGVRGAAQDPTSQILLIFLNIF